MSGLGGKGCWGWWETPPQGNGGGEARGAYVCYVCVGPCFSFHRWRLVLRGEVTRPRLCSMSLDKLGLHCRCPSSDCGSCSLGTVSMDRPSMCSSGHHNKTVSLHCFLPNKVSVYISVFSFWASVCHSQAIYFPNHIHNPRQRGKWWIQDFMGYPALFPWVEVWASNQLGRKLEFVGLTFWKGSGNQTLHGIMGAVTADCIPMFWLPPSAGSKNNTLGE